MKITDKSIIKFWILILFAANTYALILIVNSNSLDEVYKGSLRPDITALSINYILTLAFYLSIFTLFYIVSISNNKYKINIDDISRSSLNYFDYTLIILLLMYIYSILTTGIGSAGGGEIQNVGLFEYFFILIRIDYLSILYVFIVKPSPKRLSIITLVLISSLLRGWLGDILLIYLLTLGTKDTNLKNLFFSKYFIFFILTVLFYETLMNARNAYRLGGFDQLLNTNNLEEKSSIFDFLHQFLLRFQQIYSTQYLYENIEYFKSLYESGSITPLLFEGAVPEKIYNYFTQLNGDGLGYLLADHNIELIEGRKTAFSPGLISYTYLSPLSILYIIIHPLISGFIVSFYKERRMVRLTVFMHLSALFSFGWANAFFSFLSSLIILTLILFFLQKNNKPMSRIPYLFFGENK